MTNTKNTFSIWLFNPFEKIAGVKSLFIGLFAMSLTGIVVYFGKLHLDGVLDLHFGRTPTVWEITVESLIDWVSMAVLLYVAGIIVSRSAVRAVDVAGTQALARWPLFIAALLARNAPLEAMKKYVEWSVMMQGTKPDISTFQIITCFAFYSLIIITASVWTVVLMWRAYSISCNVKSKKGLWSFIIALIVAEAFSKWSISVIS